MEAHDIADRLRRNRDKFFATMGRILEKYNHAFEDDVIVCLETLTYNTPVGPKVWGETPQKIKKRNKTQEAPVESNSQLYEENPVPSRDAENSSGDVTSDVECDNVEVTLIGKQLKTINLEGKTCSFHESFSCHAALERPAQNEIKKKRLVSVDVLLQNDERNYPKWIELTDTGEAKPVRTIISSVNISTKSLPGYHDNASGRNPESPQKHTSSSLQELDPSCRSSVNKEVVPQNQRLHRDEEASGNFYVDQYLTANEECTWSDVTLQDLYPDMVNSMSRIVRASLKRTSNSQNKYSFKARLSRRYKLNNTIARLENSRKEKLDLHWRSSKKFPFPYNLSKKMINEENHQKQLSDLPCSEPCTDFEASEVVIGARSIDSGSSRKTGSCEILQSTTFPSFSLGLEDVPLDGSPYGASKLSPHSKWDPIRSKQSFQKYPSLESVVGSSTAFDSMDVGKVDSVTSCGISTLRSPTCKLNLPNMRISGEGLSSWKWKTLRNAHLQRSHSLPSSPNKDLVPGPWKYDDAFERIFHEYFPSEPQKSLTPKIKSSPLRQFGHLWLKRSPRKDEDEFENCFRKYFPRDPLKSERTWRASNPKLFVEKARLVETHWRILAPLRKFNQEYGLKESQRTSPQQNAREIPVPQTVNKLQSPVQTSPGTTRIKRETHFHCDPSLLSPAKRQKNILRSTFPKEHNHQQEHGRDCSTEVTGMIPKTWQSCNSPKLESENMNSRGLTSPMANQHGSPCTFTKESGTSGACGLNRRQIFGSPGQKLQPSASRKLSYSDGRERRSIAYLNSMSVEDPEEAFLEGYLF
ncbi:Holliday junction recognition protein isoform X1 [Ornithorhynchus anatinus]|uniref:Holliday junction recognition protein n=1 Tax=Ornithorhynchus anatinus TaxID=9258 RepID=A0A6I8NJ47_ORNAN|nr:Holliday junction recognition protein isoform X1 [Ornithorhynchus anatinus]